MPSTSSNREWSSWCALAPKVRVWWPASDTRSIYRDVPVGSWLRVNEGAETVVPFTVGRFSIE
jgi:hypothetical protein